MTTPTNPRPVPQAPNDDVERHRSGGRARTGATLAGWRRGSVAVLMAFVLAAPSWSAACDTAPHKAFDFWLGQWQVHTADGKLAGTNRIEREHGGCVIHERYDTTRGYSGESLNIYDATRQRWHQTWVDSSGTLLLLEGGLRDGAMVLEGSTTDADGKAIRHRITWTPKPDGSVRQFWESTDGQGVWGSTFDGTYTRR
jgi:hypothetical protein